ncbi:MAG: Hsp33 family molecular chaperone HslO [bacterium]
MKDYLIRVITTNKEIRALAVRSTNIVKEARKAHNTTPVATAALGRALTGTLLMGSMIKSGEEVGLVIEGDGPLRRIIVESNQKGQVRGYVSNPQIETNFNKLGKLDVARAIGIGQLKVIKRKLLKEPYESSVQLISGEIGEDLTYYFTKSEQTPSSVGLGVLVDRDTSVKAAGGFIIQLLPDAQEKTIEKLERNISNINSVSRIIEKGATPEELLEKLLDGFDFRVMARKDVSYNCKCDRKRISALISTFERKEIEEIITNQGKIEVNCHFCNQNYVFNKEEAIKLFEQNFEENGINE